MRWLCFALFGGAALAQDIAFTDRVATFTNLQGAVLTDVTIARGDLDGVIWRDASGGGRVCYTNLSPALLESWGIPTNRIETAKARAQQKAIADTKRRMAHAQMASSQALSNSNHVAAEKYRGLKEFTAKEVWNFPERVGWGERGWMDGIFDRIDSSYSHYPSVQLAFTVVDKNGDYFHKCFVEKNLGEGLEIGPPNPLVDRVMTLKKGDKLKLVGTMRPDDDSPHEAWLTVEFFEPLRP